MRIKSQYFKKKVIIFQEKSRCENTNTVAKLNQKKYELSTLKSNVAVWKKNSEYFTTENNMLDENIKRLKNKNDRLNDALNLRERKLIKENDKRNAYVTRESVSPFQKVLTNESNAYMPYKKDSEIKIVSTLRPETPKKNIDPEEKIDKEFGKIETVSLLYNVRKW